VPPSESASNTEREVEHKFQVSSSFAMPAIDDIAPVVERQETVHLSAVYYDTPDLRLIREGITLRHRSGGHDAGWHLKLPASRFSTGVRDEIGLPATHGHTDPPRELTRLIRAITGRAPIQPVATLTTARQSWLVRDSSGEVLGELTDDQVDVTDDGGESSDAFREIEFEEGPACTPAVVQEISDRLTTAGASTGTFIPKVARALGPALAPPEMPTRSHPPDSASVETAAATLTGYLRDQIRALRLADIAARRDAEDAVHQLRVSARRIRSALRVFRPLLERDWADRLRDELSWMASELGPYREAEVLLARFASYQRADAASAVDRLTTVLEDQLAAGRERLVELTDAHRYLDLHDALVDAGREPRTTPLAQQPARAVLPEIVSSVWSRLEARASDVLAAEQDSGNGASDSVWHATRLAAKRARYTVDAVADVFGPDAHALAARMSDVTDVLGEHQDASQAGALAAELAAGPANGDADDETGVAFSLGVVHEVERNHVRSARRDFVSTWEAATTPALLRWFRQ
jgi:inorganic triphosphatase YgiF